jgi:hypothetical protein
MCWWDRRPILTVPRNDTRLVPIPPSILCELDWSPSGADDSFGLYWALIYKSSADVIPSMRVLSQGEFGDSETTAYFAPNDFACHELNVRRFSPVVRPGGGELA